MGASPREAVKAACDLCIYVSEALYIMRNSRVTVIIGFIRYLKYRRSEHEKKIY